MKNRIFNLKKNHKNLFLGELVEELLLDSVTPDRLDEVTTLLEPWIKNKNPQQRLAAICTLRTVLLSYYHHMNPGYQVFF
jgi:hypothetical protein